MVLLWLGLMVMLTTRRLFLLWSLHLQWLELHKEGEGGVEEGRRMGRERGASFFLIFLLFGSFCLAFST
jgi:hypothetical protein